jgi:bisphosphoglycerate-independent phosphoglycerate mutase (AlkP superfamily)
VSNYRFKEDNPSDGEGGQRPPALRDVAPTVLHLLGLPMPPEMDGVSLLEEVEQPK